MLRLAIAELFSDTFSPVIVNIEGGMRRPKSELKIFVLLISTPLPVLTPLMSPGSPGGVIKTVPSAPRECKTTLLLVRDTPGPKASLSDETSGPMRSPVASGSALVPTSARSNAKAETSLLIGSTTTVPGVTESGKISPDKNPNAIGSAKDKVELLVTSCEKKASPLENPISFALDNRKAPFELSAAPSPMTMPLGLINQSDAKLGLRVPPESWATLSSPCINVPVSPVTRLMMFNTLGVV